jgi:hypothetical protein
MGPQPVGESGPGRRRLEHAGDELLLPQRATLRRGEHQIVRTVRPLGQVRGELLAEEPRQVHRAAGVGLGRPPHQPAIHLGRGLADLAAAAKQVQVPDTQRHQFAGAGSGVGGEADQKLIARVDGGGQVLDLWRGQEVHVPADDARQPHPGCRVAGDPAALHPGRKDLREHLMGVADPRRRQGAEWLRVDVWTTNEHLQHYCLRQGFTTSAPSCSPITRPARCSSGQPYESRRRASRRQALVSDQDSKQSKKPPGPQPPKSDEPPGRQPPKSDEPPGPQPPKHA